MVCISTHAISNLHICEGTISAEQHIQALVKHMLPLKIKIDFLKDNQISQF